MFQHPLREVFLYVPVPSKGSGFGMSQHPFKEVVLGYFTNPSGKWFRDVSIPPHASGFGMFQYPLREVVVISEDAQIRDDVKALEKYILEVRHGCNQICTFVRLEIQLLCGPLQVSSGHRV